VETNLARTLDDLLAATRDRSGKRTADIAVMTYYNPFGGDATDQNSPAYWALQLNEVITRVAAARNIPVADVATAFRGGLAYRYTYIISGDIHANADGHRLIAEQFWKALQYPGVLSSQR
jgi:lysophospholipase L1-like esterase